MTDVFSEQERRRIAGLARTLHERLDGPPNEPGPDPPMDPGELLDQWTDRFPDETSFADRLDRDGLTEETIREQVAATTWPEGEPLPGWIDELERVIVTVERSDGRVVGVDDGSRVSISGKLPFARLLAPVVEHAIGGLPGRIPVDAVAPMGEWLADRIGELWTRPLYVEFRSFVAHHDSELLDVTPHEFDDPPTELYEQFVAAMVDGGFRNLALEYPVLARQLPVVSQQWVDAVTELWDRIDQDRGVLVERFDVGGAMTSLEPLADDTHAEGRVPVRVTFESGTVVYKPRPVDAGVALYEVLDEITEDLPWSIRVPGFLPREEYGWMGDVEHRDPDDEAAVTRYYERAGMLVCVAYALGLTDCQYENVVVDGGQPTILDAETLFHPYVKPAGRTLPAGVAALLDTSVLLTSLLPWTVEKSASDEGNQAPSPTAGFENVSGEIEFTGQVRPTVEAVNTDVMAIEGQPPVVDRSSNVPTVDGEDYLPGEYVDEIVRGFERTYETILELREEHRFREDVLDPARFDGVETRLLFRGTRRYGSVLRSGTARDPLRDGARLTVAYERLAVPFFDGTVESDRLWSLYDAERQSLRRFDVPRFTADPTSTAVGHDGTPVVVDVDESGHERVRRRLDAMDEPDCRRQCWLIRRCYSPAELSETDATSTDLPDESLTEEAVELGEDLIEAALDAGRGHEWASVNSVTHPSTLTVSPTDASLYNGKGGIGLAFAALSEATGNDRFHRYARETLDAVADEVEVRPGALDLGGTAGLGSVVYALTIASELLGVERYRRVAHDVARTVTEEKLQADDTFDVMSGSAGTLLGLLAYHDRYGGSEILERAIACGERLLDGRVEVDGYGVWRTIEEEPIASFAHGTSGIAYALARLAETVADPRYEQAVRETLAFESTLYSPEHGNWLDGDDQEGAIAQWCHGPTGIALSRLGIGTQLGDEALLADAADVMTATLADDLDPVDTVCCGNFGRAGVLLEAARRTDDLAGEAGKFVARCLTRRSREGVLAMPGHSKEVTNPTFFDGVAGAAYTLLRVRNPDSLPCVLLLE